MKWFGVVLFMLAALSCPEYVFIQRELERHWQENIAEQLA
jgi:hypothetical protein